MSKFNWLDITRDDVLRAIENYLYENPEHPEPRSTFLVFEGQRLPAKHIRGMAYAVHYGVEISKADFGGGMETVRFFERLGFSVDYHGSVKEPTGGGWNTDNESESLAHTDRDGSEKSEEVKVVEMVPLLNESESLAHTERDGSEMSEEVKVIEIVPLLNESENMGLTEQVESMISEEVNVMEAVTDDKVLDGRNAVEVGAEGKISISSKGVIEQKNALQLILNRMFGGDIVCEKTYPWLKTPERIEGVYKRVFEALSAFRGDTAFAKKNVTLRCDFVCESEKLIIEYDERQHFSEARRISLEAYKDIGVLFDRSLWIRACRDICARDNAPANRDEVRAYYDSVRDIACFENGYKLVRIMHGQIDFQSADAAERLGLLFQDVLKRNGVSEDAEAMRERAALKVALYLQTDELKNLDSFNKILPVMKRADADIIVFPEYCYIPNIRTITDTEITDPDDQNRIFEHILKLSERIGKAVIVSSHDRHDTIYSVFANAYHKENETEVRLYIKHTMCGRSCLEFDSYPNLAPALFEPILLGGYRIGMTICYDCNHALFSRIYGLQGIDVIINSTGGNVIYDKWFKYNRVRAIENGCYTLVTMGGDGYGKNPHNYVFGFDKKGGQLKPFNLCGDSSRCNVSGGLYLYEIKGDVCNPERDCSNLFATRNKNWHLECRIGHSRELTKEENRIGDNIYHKRVGASNVFFIVVDGEDILKPEVVLKLLYAKELKRYGNRKYVLINRFDRIDDGFFNEVLSIVLKVRSMENFCAVILESSNINRCYQCGKNRTAQVVRETEGFWRIDLDRTSGPEAIWKNKQGMKASWRKNYEWLIENAEMFIM